MNIDGYRLLNVIGEGTFGIIYLAEQLVPLQRCVAVKVIKPGMDTRETIARFEAERQALALMDHPCIGKIHDAGTTSTGHPYFAMEFVDGVSITEFCDRHRLSFAARIRLFIDVCGAIHHAHQKGIIHRDLKPSNILVVPGEEGPVPKVIDFGVAKALGGELTSKTIFTGVTATVGTPLYMSPEQAMTGGQRLDTRSDIYSLGAVLYELLTGYPPIDPERLEKAGRGGWRRVVAEPDIAHPGTRILRDKGSIRRLADARKTTGKKLKEELKGDLGRILMKTLDHDPAQRYSTADGLAADLDACMRHLPVKARTPGIIYLTRKLARRHRLGVFTSATTAAILAGGIFLSFYLHQKAVADHRREKEAARLAREHLAQASEAHARSERERIRAEAVTDFLMAAFDSSTSWEGLPSETVGEALKASSLRERLGRKLDLSARLPRANAMGLALFRLELFRPAKLAFAQALTIGQKQNVTHSPELRASRSGLIASALNAGYFDEALCMSDAFRQDGIDPSFASFDAGPSGSLSPTKTLACLEPFTLLCQGSKDEALDRQEALIVQRLKESDPPALDAILAGAHLADYLEATDREADAANLRQVAMAAATANPGASLRAQPDEAYELVVLARKTGQSDEASRIWQKLHRSVTSAITKRDLRTLVDACLARKKFRDAGNLIAAALEGHGKGQGPRARPGIGSEACDLALKLNRMWRGRSDYDFAESLLRAALSYSKAHLESDDPKARETCKTMFFFLLRASRLEEARELIEQQVESANTGHGVDYSETWHLRLLGQLYIAEERYEDAHRLFTRLIREGTASAGADHPDVLWCRHYLAMNHDAAGEAQKAEDLFRDTLKDLCRIHGSEHQQTLATLQRLRDLLCRLGHHGEAMELVKNHLPEDHPVSRGTILKIARSYLESSRYEDADSLFIRVLAQHPLDAALRTDLKQLAEGLRAAGHEGRAESITQILEQPPDIHPAADR